MNRNLLSKILTLGVVVLFIGVIFSQNIIAVNLPKQDSEKMNKGYDIAIVDIESYIWHHGPSPFTISLCFAPTLKNVGDAPFGGYKGYSAVAVETKESIINNGSGEDCDCYNPNYKEDYPPTICSIVCAMIRVIGPTGDVIGILLIGFGYTKDEVEKMLSPLIDFYNSLLQLWGELNCPSCYP